MSEPTIRKLDVILNSASDGLELAEVALCAIREDEILTLDFSNTSRMTPSFANAFVMTVLHEVGIDALREHVKLYALNDVVAEALSRSKQNYCDGIRLSNQRTALASI